MEYKMTLREAMNTYNLALFEIKKRGYEISLMLSDDGMDILGWEAIKNKIKISAFNPLSLLGLIVISGQYGENWLQIDTGNLYDEILTNA